MTITGILVPGEKSCCKQVPASGMQRDLSPHPPSRKKEKRKKLMYELDLLLLSVNTAWQREND